MTDAEKLSALKTMLDVTGNTLDAVLNVYLTQAGTIVINRCYPFKSDAEVLAIPARYDYNQIEIAAYLYSKRGAEGEKTHNEGGINRQYESAEVPASMLKHITPYLGTF